MRNYIKFYVHILSPVFIKSDITTPHLYK
jgi:hypothetical protein